MTQETPQRILILGAGYAGLLATRALARRPGAHPVTLVDRNTYHTLETELHEAAAHAKDVTLALAPLVARSRARLFPARVTGVDLDAKRVETSEGTLEYDLLLVALGSTTNFFRIPGLADHALELKTAEDAERIHQWMLRAYHPDAGGSNSITVAGGSSSITVAGGSNSVAAAEGSSTAPVTGGPRDIIIGGAGLTGVELATELAIRAERLARESGLEAGRIHLVEAGPHILPALEPAARERAHATLLARGIQVHTDTRVTGAERGTLHLERGGPLTGGLIVWTGGVRALDLVRGERLERGAGNRIAVTETLEVKHYPGVFAAGDMALAVDAQGQPVPPTAQNASQQGKIAGRNMLAALTGRPQVKYRPSTLGEFVSLGGLLAVGWVPLGWKGRLRLAGHIAYLIKRASEWRHVARARGLID